MMLAYGLTDIFTRPMPIWDQWWLLIFPLCLAVAIVYKAVRVPSLKELPRQAAGLFIVIILSMAAAGLGLVLIVRLAAG